MLAALFLFKFLLHAVYLECCAVGGRQETDGPLQLKRQEVEETIQEHMDRAEGAPEEAIPTFGPEGQGAGGVEPGRQRQSCWEPAT